jgi:hypothetical protein
MRWLPKRNAKLVAASDRATSGLLDMLARPLPAVQETRAKLIQEVGTNPVDHAARLCFVIDATQSRARTWKAAQKIQAQMFRVAQRSGNLLAQVIYFQGTRTIAAVTDEWAGSADILVHEMAKVECRTGPTQILQSLRIARELGSTAIVLIGDAFEECPEALDVQAERFSGAGIPMFTFLEGDDREATLAFRRLAEITGGAFAVFGDDRHLGDLVTAAATYATGGTEALAQLPGAAAGEVLRQLPPPGSMGLRPQGRR